MENEWRTWSRAPVIKALQEETPPDHCVFCQRPCKGKPGARQRYVCARAECNTAYNTEWVRWRRLEKVKAGFTQRGNERKSDHPRWTQFYKEKA